MSFNTQNIELPDKKQGKNNKTSSSINNDTRGYDVVGDNLIRFFKSKFSAILISFILILLQTFHPAKVLLSFGLFESYHYFNYAYCYILALSIEFFIIYYVLRNTDTNRMYSMSMLFCVFSIMINSYYYIDLLCIKEAVFIFTYKLIPALLFAFIIPISLYRVSEEINK